MLTILYHAKTVGYIAKRIAALYPDVIKAVCDREPLEAVQGAVLRWDSRKEIPAEKTLNTAEAVITSRNKKESRKILGELAPTTWFSLQDLQFPCIIRPKRHYAASKFLVVGNKKEAIAAKKMCGVGRWYASPVILKEKEYRVFVFQGRVWKVVRRYHKDPNEIAWNSDNGGGSIRILKESWPLPVLKAAVAASQKLNLDWCAVDVIVYKDVPMVLELNTAPGMLREETLKRVARMYKWTTKHESPKIVDLDKATCKTLQHPVLR